MTFLCFFLVTFVNFTIEPLLQPRDIYTWRREPIVIERELYIAVDESKQSNMLRNELTQDWTKAINPDVLSEMNKQEKEAYRVRAEQLNSIRDNFRVKVHIIEWHDDRLDGQVVPFPCFMFGKYGDWIEFHEKTFTTSTWPLLTVDAIIERRYYERDLHLAVKKERN